MTSPTHTTKVEAVAKALREQHAALREFVRARVRPEEVDEVLQTAALRAMEKAGSLDDPARATAWLYRLHRNLIADTGRRRATERRLFTDAEEPLAKGGAPAVDEAGPQAIELCGCSVAQARRIRSGYASILELVDLGDSTIEEAAATLGISVNNANVRLHRARKALRQQMLEHCGVTSPRDCVDCRCVDDGCCAA